MAEGKWLKAQNRWLIRSALIAHVIAFAWVVLGHDRVLSLDLDGVVTRLEEVMGPGTVALGIIAVTKLLLLGLIPPNWRDRIIHWRWQNPLPGARAFSMIGPTSSRVNMDELATRYGPLPEDAKSQDKLFYSIYGQFRDETGVLDAHRSYLAARDIGTINAILMVSLPWLAWLASGEWQRATLYAGILFIAYALSAVAAENYAVRMVQNVLSLASSRALVSEKAAGGGGQVT